MTATSAPRTIRGAASPRPGTSRPQRGEEPRSAPHLTVVGEPHRRRIPVFAMLVSLVVLGSLFSLAVFHTWMAEAQFELDDVEGSLAVQRGRLADLEFQVESYNAPGTVAGLARGELGMIDPGEPVDILISPDLMAEIGTAEESYRSPVLDPVPVAGSAVPSSAGADGAESTSPDAPGSAGAGGNNR